MHNYLAALGICLPLMAGTLQSAVTPVIIDTDMGTDDVMAIALILAHREIPVEAITVVNGLAHVAAGAANARRLVQASGRPGIAVYEGRTAPLQGTAAFPADWRKTADLPISAASVLPTTNERADVWLARRLRDSGHPVRILALGPLTNLALALEGARPDSMEEIVMMGGAFHVPGNLGEAATEKRAEPVAEGNFFVDPQAAARVFRSGVKLRVVPLDATNRVKLDEPFVQGFRRNTTGPLAEIVSKVLKGAHQYIAEGSQYAWDALAACALLEPGVATWTEARVEIRVSGRERGRSVMMPGSPNAQIALDADRGQFDRIFVRAFSSGRQ